MKYKYQPKNKKELKQLINNKIKKEGNECDLNDIDTSLITDMSYLFKISQFNGNISNWNTNNVTNMDSMFSQASAFNQNISNWDVSNVTNMGGMFCNTPFNQDINDWNVSNVTDMAWLFANSQFNQPLNNWNTSNVNNMRYMFYNSQFNQNISKWNVSNIIDMSYMSYMFYKLKVPLNKKNIKLIKNKKINQYTRFCSEYADKDLKKIANKLDNLEALSIFI